MQRTYTLEELSKFLNRSTKEVQKLAEKEILKGRKVQGKWTFALPDVVLWMENEMTRLAEEETAQLEEVVASDAEVVEEVSLAALLDEAAIDLQFAAKTKASVLREMPKLAEKTGKLWDADQMAEALREREEMASTALDVGAAILHPRRPQADILAEDFLALGISPRGVPFGGGFDNLTDVFFLLCCQTDASYLRALGRLARVLRQPNFLDSLRKCADAYEVKKLIVATEQELN